MSELETLDEIRGRAELLQQADIVIGREIMQHHGAANAMRDDPTIHRCIDIGARLGYGSIHIHNLFRFRSPHPSALSSESDPVGPGNDDAIRGLVESGTRLIAAWGMTRGELVLQRVTAVLGIISGVDLWCVGRTKDGWPRHPLWVPARTLVLSLWTPPEHGVEIEVV